MRRWVARRLWNLAARVWTPANDEARDRWGFWDLSLTFRGTEDDADRLLEAACDLGHTALGLHATDSRFAVGGMRRYDDDESETPDE